MIQSFTKWQWQWYEMAKDKWQMNKHLYKWQWWANMNEYAIIQIVSEYAINNKVNMPSVLWKLLCQMNEVYILSGNGNENKMANKQDSQWWLSNMPSIQSVSKYAINNEYICHLQFQNKYANKVSMLCQENEYGKWKYTCHLQCVSNKYGKWKYACHLQCVRNIGNGNMKQTTTTKISICNEHSLWIELPSIVPVCQLWNKY